MGTTEPPRVTFARCFVNPFVRQVHATLLSDWNFKPFPPWTARAGPTGSIAAGAIIALEPSQIERPGSPSMTCWRSKGRSPGFPERCRVDDPVAKRTAIGTIAARDRAWNADELGPHFIAGEPHRRIAVTARIHEFQVRGKFRIGNCVSALQVETPGVFEARADAVLEEHVVGPFGLTRWPVGQEQRTERMILRQSMLISLHCPGAGQRGADEMLELFSSGYSGGKIFHKAAFAAALGGQQGAFGRNVLADLTRRRPISDCCGCFASPKGPAFVSGAKLGNCLRHERRQWRLQP